MSLFTEIKRRKVFRVAVVYAATGFVILQAAELMLPRLGIPDWVSALIVVLVILGFPIALVLGWALELTPEGVKVAPRRNQEAVDEPPPSLLGKRTVFVAALLVAVGIGLGAGWFLRPTPPLPEVAPEPVAAIEPVTDAEDLPKPAADPVRTSIAVLPFANMSPDPDQEFFADGITEDILTRLAGIQGLRVISRTSVMRYKGTTLGIPEIAAELGVTHVLEGSVRRAGDRVRITGQLIRAEDDAHLWAESFDRELADIFAVQTEIAEEIATRLELQLTDQERRRLAMRGTDNPLAYEHYLRGREAMLRPFARPQEADGSRAEAERWFRAALAEDPDFGAAHAGLASVLRILFRVPAEARAARLEAAAAAARQAIRLSPEMSAGHVELGHVYLSLGLEEVAIDHFEQAARLEPDAPETLQALATLHLSRGAYTKAIVTARRLIEIEPGQSRLHHSLAVLYSHIGVLDAAEAELQRAWEELTPLPARWWSFRARLQLQRGDRQAARASIDDAQAFLPDSEFAANVAVSVYLMLRDADALAGVLARHREFMVQHAPLVYAQALAFIGQHEAVPTILDEVERQLREDLPRRSSLYIQRDLATIALLRGDHEAALNQLARAIEMGWRIHRELALKPAWDPLRDNPRFQTLEAKVEEDLARIRAELGLDETRP